MDDSKNKKIYTSITAFIVVGAILVAGFFIWIARDKKERSDFVYEKPEDAFNVPAMDILGDAAHEYLDFILNNAVQTNTIELRDCKSEPLIAEVAFGSDIVFKNTDNTPHTLFWSYNVKNDREEMEIPANGEDFITTDFVAQEELGDVAIIGYGCDHPENTAGIVLILDGPALP